MILKIRTWCEELIIAIVLCIIIEGLIPNGNNKKYAKVIIGIYIMFITINPILEFMNYNLNFDEIVNFEYEETYSDLNYDMKDVYIIGIEETIKQEINDMGFIVNKIEMIFDNNYEKIDKIEIEILEENRNENIESDNYQNILKMLKENYFVENDDIYISFK